MVYNPENMYELFTRIFDGGLIGELILEEVSEFLVHNHYSTTEILNNIRHSCSVYIYIYCVFRGYFTLENVT